jgi:hypothetical protein
LAYSLFQRLPDIWKDLDLRVSDVVLNSECQACGYSIEEDYFSARCPQCGKLIGGAGLLERFLRVPDAGVARIEDLIAEFLRAHNIEKIRERFVPLFDPLTGHRWKGTKSYQWNRNRSEITITRNSAKGADDLIRLLVKEHGSAWCDIVDMASTVAVWDRQGVYTQNDDYFYNADFHHPGVFLLYVQDSIDLESFLEDFQYIQPAGTKWYIYRTVTEGVDVSIEMLNYSLPVIEMETGTNRGLRIYTEENNFFDFVPQPAPLPSRFISTGEVLAVTNAYLTLDSMTYRIDDEEIQLDDIYLDTVNNMRQPGVEPDVPS